MWCLCDAALCFQDLSKDLNGSSWPAADAPLVTACFRLLSAVSSSTIKARFVESGSSSSSTTSGAVSMLDAHTSTQEHQCYPPGSSSRGGQSSLQQPAVAQQQAGNRFDATPTDAIGSSVVMHFKPGGQVASDTNSSSSRWWGVGRCKAWLGGIAHRRQGARQGRAITAQQMLRLPLYRELAEAMRVHGGAAGCGSSIVGGGG